MGYRRRRTRHSDRAWDASIHCLGAGWRCWAFQRLTHCATSISALYDSRIFPIFLMWETDLWSTLKDIADDQKVPMDRTTGTMWDKIKYALSRFLSIFNWPT